MVSRRVTVAQIKSMRDLDHSCRHDMLRHCQEPWIEPVGKDNAQQRSAEDRGDLTKLEAVKNAG